MMQQGQFLELQDNRDSMTKRQSGVPVLARQIHFSMRIAPAITHPTLFPIRVTIEKLPLGRACTYWALDIELPLA